MIGGQLVHMEERPEIGEQAREVKEGYGTEEEDEGMRRQRR